MTSVLKNVNLNYVCSAAFISFPFLVCIVFLVPAFGHRFVFASDLVLWDPNVPLTDFLHDPADNLFFDFAGVTGEV